METTFGHTAPDTGSAATAPHCHCSLEDLRKQHPGRRCWVCMRSEDFDGIVLRTCGGCKVDRYCGKECQKVAWPIHKQHCENHGRQMQSKKSLKALSKFALEQETILGNAAVDCFRRYYLPPRSQDRVATAWQREDVVVVDIGYNPNVKEAAAGRKLCVLDAHSGSIESEMPPADVHETRQRLQQCKLEAKQENENEQTGVILIILNLRDPGNPGQVQQYMKPFAFLLDDTPESRCAGMPWDEYLLDKLGFIA